MKKSLLVLAIVLLVAFGAAAQTISGSFSYELGMEFVPEDDNGTPSDTSDDVAAHVSASEDGSATGSVTFTSEDGAASATLSLDADAADLSGDAAHASFSLDPLALLGVEAPVSVGMTLASGADESLTVTVPDVVVIGFSYEIADILNGTDDLPIGITADLKAVPGLTLGLAYNMNSDYVTATSTSYDLTATSDFTDEEVTTNVTGLDISTATGTGEDVDVDAIIDYLGSVSWSVEAVDDETTAPTDTMSVDLAVDLVALAGLPLDAASVSFGLAMDDLSDADANDDSDMSWDTGVDVAMAGASVGITFNSDSELGLTASYAGVPNLTNEVSLGMTFTADDPDTAADESDVATSLGLSLGYAISDALSTSLAIDDLLADYMGLTIGCSLAAGDYDFGLELTGLTETDDDASYSFDGADTITLGADPDAVADNFVLTFTIGGSF